MDNNEIKKANRKAMPKFMLIMVISLLVGGSIGFWSAKNGLNNLVGAIKDTGAFFGLRIAPWFMLAIAMITPIPCAVLYHNAKNLLSAWDGEDEEIADAIDKKLSVTLWISNAALVFSYFLIAAAYAGGFATFEHKDSVLQFSIGLIAFAAVMIEMVIIQQKCVDAAKIMSPEKSASIYDLKFQKKWMDSCDEAEKVMVGKCAFRAYTATNNVCTALASILAIGALVFGIGFLPSFAVCLIWIVNLSVYSKEALRYSKAGNKIS